MGKINWFQELMGMGFPRDNYLCTRLRSFYQYGLKKGLDSDAALKYAKDRFRVNLSKSARDDKPVREKKRNTITLQPLSEDDILASFKSGSPRIREFINKRLTEIAGVDNLDRAWRIFKRVKSQGKLNVGESLSEVIRIIGKDKKVVDNDSKVESDVFDISRDHELYDFVRSMDPKNAEKNLALFKLYRSQGFRVNSALDRIRKIGELREFCDEQDIPITVASRLIYYYSSVEDIKRVLLDWKREGRFSIDSEYLMRGKSEDVEDNPFVIYNGNKIRLKRLVHYLFRGKLSARELKIMYSSILHNYFDFGKTIDESIERGVKTIKFYRAKDSIVKEFPVDPDAALALFEEYYLTEGKSFEEAMELTRREIGASVNKNVRIANCMDRQGYYKLADLFIQYLSR